ncbi:MAG: single-stranded DNA-binding protein [Rhodomicrobium sp.]|nr:single-stranded DNA-binding protein [Rhodomicrobium sp.]
MNEARLIGNLGTDPVIKPTANGKEAAFFPVATTARWNDRATGEPREDTQWHQIAVFDPKLVEIAKEQLRKGSLVRIEGRIVNSKWTDAEGRERFSSQVHLSGPKAVLTLIERQQSSSVGRGR